MAKGQYEYPLSDEKGNYRWATIGGRRIKIYEHQSLADAMIESGKFKGQKNKPGMRESFREQKEKDLKEEEELYKESQEQNTREAERKRQDKFRENEELYPAQKVQSIDMNEKGMREKYREEQDNKIKEQLDKDTEDLNSYDKYNLAVSKLEQDENMTRSERAYWTKTRDDYVANEKAREKQIDEESNNWREQIKQNNDQLEKDLEEYKNTHNMAREDEANGYYELFRENERRNAKLKQEKPDEKYEFVEAYATYRDKRDKLEGVTRDENGNRNYDNMKDATWTGKEYTNDEFLENLEDENWHTERKMLLDANLTNAQMEFVKNNTTFHNGSPSLDRETTEELIKGAKGEKFRNPDEIKTERNTKEIADLKNKLDYVSKNGKSGLEEDYRSYSDYKERYKQLTGKDYDDSNIKIPYDPNKTYEYSNGVKINQDLMKERYSGRNPEDIQHDIDFNKKILMDYNPKDRELHNAEIKEMEKYLDSLPKYESRISDDFGTKDWEEGYGNQWGESSWKGTKSNSGLYGKDKIKAIDDEIKKAYPGIKTSRKTGQGGLTDSFSYSIMESDEPIIRSIDDFSDSEIDRLYNSGYNRNWYNSKEEYKEALKKDLEKGYLDVNQYNIDNDHRLTPYGKRLFKDIMKVSDAYNYDESASQVDYFNTGHYMSIGVGKYDKPYQVKEKSTPKTTNETMNQAIREKAKTRNISGRNEIKNASPSQIEKGDLIGPKKLLVTAVRPASVEKDGYSSGYSVTTKDSNGNTSRQIISDSARNTIYKKSTNESMNNAIREKASNKYAGTKRWGFGYANDDNIPVYDNKIDYGGDFSHANLSSVSDSELKELYSKQSELYNRAVNTSVGDRRTHNGRQSQIIKDVDLLRYGNGIQKAEEEMAKRGIKSNNMSETIRREANLKNAFRQYKREHPESKMTLNQFRNMNK